MHCCSTILNFLFNHRTVAADSKYVIPPEKKWMSLFSECRQSLGCHGDRDAEHWIVWKCVSIALTTGRDSKVSRNDFEITKELIKINDDMEQTAKVCDDLQTVQAYLSKVSEVALPLKTLLHQKYLITRWIRYFFAC